MKILVIEDHHEIAGIIFDFFEIKGYDLDYAADGQHGLELGLNNHYDLILLDYMLPKKDGMEVARLLRKNGNTTPILMLTARDEKHDILNGFDAGVDDYLVKPFDLHILDARMKALVKRQYGVVASDVIKFDELKLDLNSHNIKRGECSFHLNNTQFQIMKLLMMNAPKVTSREEIIHVLWQDNETDNDILRGHIYQLRRLIDRPFKHQYIQTIPKVGYQLNSSSS